MRSAFVSADTPVFAFIANRFAEHMANPKIGAWNWLKTCVRHMHGHSRCIRKFPVQDDIHRIDDTTDSDWAQDRDRNSGSSVVIMIGTHCLRVQFATQTAPTIPSGAAAFVAQVKDASV